jgi:UDP-N-acetylmuramate: L-alanyl-gamma-D-glutamyl-meso-diaminopimelate ligase
MAAPLFSDSNIRAIHFIGIGGTAMASVAVELNRSEFTVTGSDAGIYPPMSELLEREKIAVREGFAPENLPDGALVVVGNAISRGNTELEAALNQRLPIISLPELISRRYLAGKLPIVVAGTHGKSTTTTMVAYILQRAGRQSGWLVGAQPLDWELPCQAAVGDEFVIEGDEYDSVWWDKRPKFMHYRPFIGVINAVEFDHADIYPDLEAVKAAFRRFAGLLPEQGRLIINGDDANAREVAQAARCPVETVGVGEGCAWRLRKISNSESGVCGEFITPQGEGGRIELQLLGEYNLRNALTAIAAASAVDVDVQSAVGYLKDFQGVARRLQLVVEAGGVALWDDFGHHPTAIRETLLALRRRYPGRRLWALLEPRSNTMVRNYLQDELIAALGLADVALIAPLHRGDRVAIDVRLDVDAVVGAVRGLGREARYFFKFDELSDFVQRELRNDDVLVMMSNGKFGELKERLAELIKSRD